MSQNRYKMMLVLFDRAFGYLPPSLTSPFLVVGSSVSQCSAIIIIGITISAGDDDTVVKRSQGVLIKC